MKIKSEKKAGKKTVKNKFRKILQKINLEKNGECIKRDVLETDFFAPLEHK